MVKAILVQSWHNLSTISAQSQCNLGAASFTQSCVPLKLHSLHNFPTAHRTYSFMSSLLNIHYDIELSLIELLVINYLKIRRDKIMNITTAQPLSEAGSLFKHNLSRLGSLWISMLWKDACSTNGQTIM